MAVAVYGLVRSRIVLYVSVCVECLCPCCVVCLVYVSPLFPLCQLPQIVVYEAARSIVNMKNVTAREIQPAVSMLQIFLGSPKPTLRYAAVKTLSRIATLHPTVVTTCNMDLEGLITDSNRSIATLAITTLLKVSTVPTVISTPAGGTQTQCG